MRLQVQCRVGKRSGRHICSQGRFLRLRLVDGHHQKGSQAHERIPERIGPYRILKRIGRGGVGEVFAAVHEHIGQQVALRVLLPEHASDPETAARFIREARALAQFGNHPGIVRVYHFDRPEGGVAYLAMYMSVSFRYASSWASRKLFWELGMATNDLQILIVVDVYPGVSEQDLKAMLPAEREDRKILRLSAFDARVHRQRFLHHVLESVLQGNGRYVYPDAWRFSVNA